jgi:tetratricopeptide (TPR) repeat protein
LAKKTTKTKSQTKRQPEPAQLKAIERLLSAENYTEVIPRVEALIRRFPEHSGLRAILIAALGRSRGPRAAGPHIFAWAEQRPNSLRAQEALLRFAIESSHLMLAERTADRVRALGGDTPGFPIDPAIRPSLLMGPDGTQASVEEVVRYDIGQLHLQAQDFAGAVHWLEGVSFVPARNNHALALFYLGRIEDAHDAFMDGWKADADNLFALAYAARLRLYRGDEAGARGLCTPLAAAKARRLDDAVPQVDALLLLDQDQAAWEAFDVAQHSGWQDEGGNISRAALRHFGACAAARLGKGALARRLWREAADMPVGLTLPGVNLGLFDRDGQAPAYPAAWDLYQALPHTWINTLRAQQKKPDPVLDSLRASNAYLRALYIGGDQILRGVVTLALKRRARRSDQEAARLLRGFAAQPIGTADERFGLLTFLQNEGLVSRNEPVDYWDGETTRQVKVIGTDISREPKESGLPPDLDELLTEAIERIRDGQPEESESRLNAILQRAPDHPVVLGNLAAVRVQQGRKDEARSLLRQIVAKHPDYLFARCNLARFLIQDGKLDEADALLKGLVEREDLHIQEVFVLYGTLAMFQMAKGDKESAAAFLKSLESLVEDEGDEDRLERIKGLVDGLKPMGRFKALLRAAVKTGRRSLRRGG